MRRPSLGGTRIRQRKRNITVPLDHASFADVVVGVFQDAAAEGAGAAEGGVEAALLAGVKALEVAGADLDYGRYGDTLFELLFTGGRFAGGSMEVEFGESKLETNVFDSPPDVAAVKPYVVAMQHVLRRRPFLVKNLENTVKKLLQLLEHYGPAERDKIANLLSQVFIQRLGVPPENVFGVLLNDVMVAKGTSLAFLTSLFRAWLKDSTLDELVAVLRRGRVEDRLLEFFPQQRRTPEAFQAHFGAEGLGDLVSYSVKRVADARARELRDGLAELLADGGGVVEGVELLRATRAKPGGLPDADAVAAAWAALLGSVDTANKNSAAVTAAVVKQLRAWARLLAAATGGSKRLQADLLARVQTSCYDDPALLKSFAEIVRHLYDKDVLSEEVVLAWVKKGPNPKGRTVFLKDLEKFVAWLEQAEEESDGDDGPAAAAKPAVVAAADAAQDAA